MGRKDWDNGAVLFVFVDDRKMRIETGYGLEGALPDQLAGRILDEQVRPRFRAGDWAGGLEAGIDGIMAATRGEYTAPPQKAQEGVPLVALLIIACFVILFFWLASQGPRNGSVGRTYGSRGWRRGGGTWGGGSTWGGGGWGGGGGGAVAAVAAASPAAGAPSAAAGPRAAGEDESMKPDAFVAALDDERIVAAIREAEALSRGEIRVHVAELEVTDPRTEAAVVFERLGMADTAERTGVLIFVAPESQSITVIGDREAHERCGDAFWEAVVQAVREDFRAGRFTEGIVGAVRAIAAELERHFPRRPGETDRNELPDSVSRG